MEIFFIKSFPFLFDESWWTSRAGRERPIDRRGWKWREQGRKSREKEGNWQKRKEIAFIHRQTSDEETKKMKREKGREGPVCHSPSEVEVRSLSCFLLDNELHSATTATLTTTTFLKLPTLFTLGRCSRKIFFSLTMFNLFLSKKFINFFYNFLLFNNRLLGNVVRQQWK